jgi:hypothetical protein
VEKLWIGFSFFYTVYAGSNTTLGVYFSSEKSLPANLLGSVCG